MIDIVFLITDIHFGGGGERVTVNLANSFSKKGYKVTIVSVAVPHKTNIFIIQEGIKIDYLGIDFNKGLNTINKIRSVFKVRKYYKLHELERNDSSTKPISRIRGVETRHALSLHEHTIVLGIGTYSNLLLSFLPYNKKIKRIGCQHCSYASLNTFWRFLGKSFFKRLDVIVSLTERDVSNWKTLNRNVEVIPNAVSFYPGERAFLRNKVILAIGRIDHGKGYDLLMDVFERFAAKEKEWCLRIIGEGPLKEKIKHRIDRQGLGKRVQMLSPTDNVEEEYRQASVYLMTSRSEGLPMVLLEAKAFGLPIVSFDCETGPSDIIKEGKDGFLIECFDVDEMAEKLGALCSDLSLRREFGSHGREDVKRFFPEIVSQKWEGLFEDLKMR